MKISIVTEPGLFYPSFLLNVLPARVRVRSAMIIRGSQFAMASLKLIPFRKIPLVRTMKNLTGFSQVKYCKAVGISSIGEINPDRE